MFTGATLPYYRFMNASAAPMALVGLGAFVAIRWFLRERRGAALVAGALGAVVVVASLGYVLVDGVQNRWVSDDEPVGQPAGAHVARGGERGGRRSRGACRTCWS